MYFCVLCEDFEAAPYNYAQMRRSYGSLVLRLFQIFIYVVTLMSRSMRIICISMKVQCKHKKCGRGWRSEGEKE